MADWLRDKQNIRKIGRFCGWLTLALVLLSMLTGYGITEYRIVDSLTLGIFNKAVAQRLHPYTDVPLIAVMIVHVSLALWARLTAPNRKG